MAVGKNKYVDDGLESVLDGWMEMVYIHVAIYHHPSSGNIDDIWMV
jgi:hypothetical protein